MISVPCVEGLGCSLMEVMSEKASEWAKEACEVGRREGVLLVEACFFLVDDDDGVYL